MILSSIGWLGSAPAPERENSQIGELLHATYQSQQKYFRIFSFAFEKNRNDSMRFPRTSALFVARRKRFSAQPRNRTAFLSAARARCDVNALKSNLNMKSKFQFSANNLKRSARVSRKPERRPLSAGSVDSGEHGSKGGEAEGRKTSTARTSNL